MKQLCAICVQSDASNSTNKNGILCISDAGFLHVVFIRTIRIWPTCINYLVSHTSFQQTIAKPYVHLIKNPTVMNFGDRVEHAQYTNKNRVETYILLMSFFHILHENFQATTYTKYQHSYLISIFTKISTI